MSFDIEDLVNKEKDKYGSFFENIDNNIVPLIKELCEQQINNFIELKEKLRELSKKYHILPSKPQMCFVYDSMIKDNIINENPIIKKFIKSKEMRGLSGVIVISVITSPYPEYIDENGVHKKQNFSCKHDCFYCPKEVDDNGKDINPRSYLSDEPTVARGLQNDFDAVKQFNDRAYQYVINSHYVDKIEIIVLGGTWTEYPKKYQETFIRDIFWAANTFYKAEKREKLTLLEEQKINEDAKSRIIGLTLEMRPDSINEEEIAWLRYLGCTRVQLGVQHTDRKILKKVNRGCYAEDAIRALKLLKNYCYKVDAHWMPDLPGSSPEIDKEMFDYILTSPDLQFDQWKIYPTSVVPWTKIKQWFDKGEYIPYTDKNPQYLINLLLYVKERVHPWIRLNRVVRDIPNKTRDGVLYIYGGNQKTNLRQILHNEMKEKGKFCPCIRCREVKSNTSLINEAEICVREYDSSDGKEYFISIESGNKHFCHFKNGKWYDEWNLEIPPIIYGFLRLRICNNKSNSYFAEIHNSGLIRELHVYGQVVSKNNKEIHLNETQNKGFGKMLMKKAEEIVMDNAYMKVSVISGIGVKNYYRSLGYKEYNTYMIKKIHVLKFIYYHVNKYNILVSIVIICNLLNYLT